MAVDFGHILLEHVTNTYNLYRKRANETCFWSQCLRCCHPLSQDDFRDVVLDYTDKDDYADMEKS